MSSIVRCESRPFKYLQFYETLGYDRFWPRRHDELPCLVSQMIQNLKLQPGQRVGNYVLQSKVGEGAFSEVWKANHHERTDRLVAIKMATDLSFRRQLTKEARLVRIDHEGIVPILDSDTFFDPPYIVMPYYERGSLADLIRQNPQGLNLQQLNCIFSRILEAMSAAHESRIVHRDLKPSNILLKSSEIPAVTDFGLCLVPNPEGSMIQSLSLERESNGQLVGTLAYMAPEVRDGAEASCASDVYSLGVILFEMLTGRRPCGPEQPSHIREATDLNRLWDRLYSEACCSHASRIPDACDLRERYGGVTSSMKFAVAKGAVARQTNLPHRFPGKNESVSAASSGSIDGNKLAFVKLSVEPKDVRYRQSFRATLEIGIRKYQSYGHVVDIGSMLALIDPKSEISIFGTRFQETSCELRTMDNARYQYFIYRQSLEVVADQVGRMNVGPISIMVNYPVALRKVGQGYQVIANRRETAFAEAVQVQVT